MERRPSATLQEEASRIWSSTPPSPMWLDCDTGHGDAFAILLAAQCPSINLLGISTVFGNAPLSHTTHNTLAILTAINRTDIPVLAGASKPFCRIAASAPDIHGATGLDGTTHLPSPTITARKSSSCISSIYEALIAQTSPKPWIVAVGSLTNIALLFATYPDLVSHVVGLSIMGGAIGSEFTSAPMGTVEGQGTRFGNWTPWAEFNIYLDPEAAQSIFMNEELAAKTTLCPLDLTHLMLATKDVQQGLLHGFDDGSLKAATSGEDHAHRPSDVRLMFNEILTFFASTYASVFGITAGPPLHDPLAVAAAFAPGLFDDRNGERFSVSIVTDGEHGNDLVVRKSSQCGRTVVRKLEGGKAGVRIPRALDTEVIWRMLDLCMTQVDEMSA